MQVDNSCIHLSIYDHFNEIPKKCITSTMKGAFNLYNQSFKVERENRNTDHQVTSTNRLLLWHYVLRNVIGICTDWHDTQGKNVYRLVCSFRVLISINLLFFLRA